jgi:hypothetical protein
MQLAEYSGRRLLVLITVERLLLRCMFDKGDIARITFQLRQSNDGSGKASQVGRSLRSL